MDSGGRIGYRFSSGGREDGGDVPCKGSDWAAAVAWQRAYDGGDIR